MTVDPRREEARRLFHEERLSKAEIARRLNANINSVMSWLPPSGVLADHELRRQAQAMRAQGLTNIEIGRRLGKTRQRIAQILGPVEGYAPTSGAHTTITAAPETLSAVRQIAFDLGLVARRGRTAGEGSINQLLDALASGELTVSRPSDRS